MATTPAPKPPPEVTSIGILYRRGKDKGFVIVRLVTSGTRVISQDIVSPAGPEPINFAAGRLKAECARLLQDLRESLDAPLPAGDP